MFKKIFLIVSFFLCGLVFSQKIRIEKKSDINSINNTTEEPVIVKVDGDLLVESYINVNEIVPKNPKTVIVDGVTKTMDPLLLVRSNDTQPSGELKILDISKRLVGPVNKFVVNVSNVDKDKLVRLNTNLLTDKYVVAITDAVFSGAVSASTSINNKKHFGAFNTEVARVKVEYTFPKKTCAPDESDSTEIKCTVHATDTVKKELEFYAVDVDFKGAETFSSVNGTWTFSLVVYEKSLVKQWPDIQASVNMNGGSPVGQSTNTPKGFIKNTEK